MSCGSKGVTTLRNAKVPRDFVLRDLEERGRLQFFFHSRSSKLPVRDVDGKQKNEPHLEKQAENYCTTCYQANILGFLKSKEKYLFLFTMCRNKRMRKHYRKRFIVGYLVKREAIPRTDGKNKWWAVQGPTKMYSFEDAYLLKSLVSHARNIRVKKLNAERTTKTLQHFRERKRKHILRKCLAELERLKRLQNKPRKGGRGCG